MLQRVVFLLCYLLSLSHSFLNHKNDIRKTVAQISKVHFQSGIGRENITIDPKKIEDFITNITKCRDSLSAVTIAIVQLDHEDNVVDQYNQAYGMLDPARPEEGEVDEHSRFCIGSITKQFTAALVGLALEEKGLDYDAKLVDLLGEEGRFYNKVNLDQLPTVRDLLSHRMGIPRYDTPWLFGLNGTRLEYWNRLHFLADRDDDHVSKRYRSSFEYNNWMVSLAGYVMERLSNRTWEDAVNDTYYTMLGLDNATFADLLFWEPPIPGHPNIVLKPHKLWDNVAVPAYRVVNDTEKNFSWIPISKDFLRQPIQKAAPAGAICFSSVDMLKYMTFLVNSTKETRGHKEERKLKKKILQTMDETSNFIQQPPAVSMPNGPLVALNNYALAWGKGFYRGYEMTTHDGGYFGWLSNEAIFPKLKLGIFVSTTNGLADDDLSQVITLGLFDMVMGKNGDGYTAEKICGLAPFPPQANPESLKPYKSCMDTRDFLELEPLVGTYQHQVFGNISITYNRSGDEFGRLRFNYGKFGHGILCPTAVHPYNREFQLYFDSDSPLWFYNDAETPGSDLRFTFGRDNANRGTHFVFPGLELESPTINLQSFYKQDYHPCEPSPCMNGGKCVMLGELNFICQCPSPITGTVCDKTPLRDCSDWHTYHPEARNHNGLYPIEIPGFEEKFNVYCDMKTDGGGWTVIHRRINGSVPFDVNLANYTDGFGEPGPHDDYWIGLEAMHQLASSADNSYELMVELGDCSDIMAYETYSGFWIGDQSTKYTLHLSTGSAGGNASDALTIRNSYFVHNNMPFSTFDDDNENNCASQYHSGWWFNDCFAANLNGKYYEDCKSGNNDGIIWLPFRSSTYSLKYASMKIRRKQ